MDTSITQRKSKYTHGYTLVIVMSTVVTMAALLGSASYLNQQSRLMATRSVEVIDTTLVADAAMRQMFGQMKQILAMPNSLPSNVTFQTLSQTFNTNTAPTNDFPVNEYRFLNYTILPLTTNGVPANIPDSEIVDGRQFRFLGVVWVQSLKNPAVISKIQQEMQFTFKPLFQYAIFYHPDMEMHNGPAMVIGGNTHCNGRIYAFNSGQLTFNGQVTSVNGFQYSGIPDSRAENRTTSSNKVTFGSGPSSLTTPKTLPGMLDTTNTLGNPNMSTNGAIALVKRPVLGNHNGTNYTMHGTDPATIDPYAPVAGLDLNHPDQVNVRMYYKADLRILVDNSRIPQFYTGEVTDANPNGTLIPPSITNVTSGVTNIIPNQTYTRLAGSITTTNRFSDFRWNYDPVAQSNIAANGITNVTTIDINVQNLIDTNGNLRSELSTIQTTNLGGILITNTTPIPNFKGVVYASNVDGSSTNKQGVVVRNGENLPNTGLTVVTDNPLYLVGDYNTGGTGNSVMTQNTSSRRNNKDSTFNLNNSTAPGYTRKPASLMADAVSIVSRRYYYNNTMMNPDLDDRDTQATTVNTAILSGYVASGINTNNPTQNFLSGGNHNFPRFLEKWGDKLVINGSMVNLFESEQGIDPFYCNATTSGGNAELPSNVTASNFDKYYQPPTRVWSFDTEYLDPTKMPPGTPMVREFNQGQWAKVP